MLEVAVLVVMVPCVIAALALGVWVGRAKRAGDAEAMRQYIVLVVGILFCATALNNIGQDTRVDQIPGVAIGANGVMFAVIGAFPAPAANGGQAVGTR